MLLHLTDTSSETLQSQLTRQIRARILTGDISDGDSLPSIRSMARQQHVSVITVQRSYEELERLGLIIARRGKGFFVCSLTDALKELLAVQRFVEEVKPFVRAALDEGLSAEKIIGSVTDIIENKDKEYE